MTDFMVATPVSESDERIARARRAAKRARELRGQWQSYARMILRQPKLVVQFTAGTPHTDGKTIWLRVPIELGDDLPHTRSLCGHRDPETLMQKCEMCKVLEDCQITMYHEVSHIAFDSFMELDDRDRKNALIEAVRLEAEGQPESKRMKKIEKQFDKYPPTGFLMAAAHISPWLQMLINAGEDARVNKQMMDARPGARAMFAAQVTSVFRDGNTQLDGSTMRWGEDKPLNAQACIAIYCKITDFDYRPYLDPFVVAQLEDDVLDDLCINLKTARTARLVFHACVPILERLRELGFCKSEEDTEDDEPQPPLFKMPMAGAGSSDEDQEEQEDEDGDGESGGTSLSVSSGGSSTSDSGGGSPEQDDKQESESPEDQEDNSEDQSTGSQEQSDNSDDEQDDEPSLGGGSTADEGEDSAESSDNDDSDSAPESPVSPGEPEPDTDSGADNGDDTDENSDQSDEAEDAEPDTGDLQNPTPSDSSESDENDQPDPFKDMDFGTPEEVSEEFGKFARHDQVKLDDDDIAPEGDGQLGASDEDDQHAVEVALIQAEHFDTNSKNVVGVVVRKNGEDGDAWKRGHSYYSDEPGPLPKLPEAIMAPSLQRLRILFSENKRTKQHRDLRSGRVNGKVLGRRVPVDDDRLFQKRTRPGKRDYCVIIGGDVSGSTNRPGVIELIKSSMYAQAELLNRLGIKFAVYAHTGDVLRNDNPLGTGSHIDPSGHSWVHQGIDVEIYEIKSAEEPWTDKTRERLAMLRPAAANLDGHTLEFYRKTIQRVKATDKLIMYYTDGAMPLENYTEELEILQREIEMCKRLGIHLVGVGVRNDDPTEHGLDTIRIDTLEDIPLVVKGLEKRIA